MNSINPATDRIKFAVVILERERVKKLIFHLNEMGMKYQLAALGTGTAPPGIIGYTGLGEAEKVVLMFVVKASEAKRIFDDINQEMDFIKGQGIAFTLPINSIGSFDAAQFVLKNNCAET